MQNSEQKGFFPKYLIIGNTIKGAKNAMRLEGVPSALIYGNNISDSNTAVELKNCNGRIDIKKNKGTRVKTFVRINTQHLSPLKIKEIKKNIEYQIVFNRRIKELLNLEAQAKFLKKYEDLKKIRFLKAHLKIKI